MPYPRHVAAPHLASQKSLTITGARSREAVLTLIDAGPSWGRTRRAVTASLAGVVRQHS